MLLVTQQEEEMIKKYKSMRIQLVEKDYDTIATAIVDSERNEGSIYVEIEGLEFEVSFEKEIGGYIEDDYNNGTGGFVCTDAVVRVKNIELMDIEVIYNDTRIEILAERMLKS